MKSPIIFDGRSAAAGKELDLAFTVTELEDQHITVTIAAILFTEDLGSQIYSEHKKQTAERVGISYQLHPFSIMTNVTEVSETIEQLNQDSSVTGIIIQKPTRKTWMAHQTAVPADPKTAYDTWWQSLYKQVDPAKDVDGLHPSTLAAIESDTWQEQGRVLPATVEGVLMALNHPANQAVMEDPATQFVIIGRSDLVGQPLAHLLKNQGRVVELLGKAALQERQESGKKLLDADVIVTATGKRDLVTGDMVKEGAVVIDVGEPRADVEWESVLQKSAFLTPVPGGIGPLTIVCLLENALKLARQHAVV